MASLWTEKIQSVLYIPYHALSYDLLLDMLFFYVIMVLTLTFIVGAQDQSWQ